MESFGEMVWHAREIAEDTQGSVGKAIGKTTGYISAIETERAMPSVKTIKKLAAHYGLDLKKCLACYANAYLKRHFKEVGVRTILKLMLG